MDVFGARPGFFVGVCAPECGQTCGVWFAPTMKMNLATQACNLQKALYLSQCMLNHAPTCALMTALTAGFILEFVVKHLGCGIVGYWRDPWNILDGLIVVLSIVSY